MLECLKKSGLPFEFIEFEAENGRTGDELGREAERVRREAQERLCRGENVVIYTSRKVQSGEVPTPEHALKFSVEISKALVGIIRGLQISPSFLIAKGGITSSDTGTKGLGVKRASVLGQAIPGVPVWLTGTESRYSGNVGDENSLRVLAEKIIV